MEEDLLVSHRKGDQNKKKGSVAFSLSTLRNMMCCVRFQGT